MPLYSDEVKLHAVLGWTCPACGECNYVEPVLMETTEEERRELYARHGLNPDKYKHKPAWYGRPEEVTCPHCNVDFPVAPHVPGEI